MQAKKSDSLIDQVIKLNADVKMALHTRIAQSLFNGSWKHGKMGLLQFAKVIGAIWAAAKIDDPYAEWYLLKTYQELYDARQQLKLMEEKLTLYFTNLRGIEINSCVSTNPANYPLQFSTPFGYMGAYLIADVDYVLRQLLTLKHIGIPVHQEDISIRMIIRNVQEVFFAPRYWHHTGVTRQDIKEDNQKAQLAKKRLGELPDSVFNKEIEFSFLPKVQGKKNNE